MLQVAVSKIITFYFKKRLKISWVYKNIHRDTRDIININPKCCREEARD